MSNVKYKISNVKPQISLVVVWALIFVFVVTFVILSLRRHAALGSNGMDLGNVDQALWNTAQGDFLAFTNMAPVRNRLALHVEPILLLFVPFYGVGLGGPGLLLVVQAIVVGLGALPLYWLARDALSNQRISESANQQAPPPVSQVALLPTPYSLLLIVFPLAYLLFPALEAAVMYDFHAVTLAPTFLLFAFYFGLKRRPWPFSLFVLLALASKEDMGLTVAMLGLFVIIVWRRWRWGAMTALVGLVWFALAVFVIQPRFSPTGGNIQADRYAWLGDTPLTMMRTIVRRPIMVWDHVWREANLPGYLAGLLLPTAFLSVFAPLAWLAALPSLAVNLLSDNSFTWRLEDFHYAAPIVPFVMIATVYGAQRLSKWVGRSSGASARAVLIVVSVLLLVASLAYHYARGFSPLSRPFQPWAISDHQRQAETVFENVPPDAALFAQSNLNPHLSSRRVLYQDPAVLTDPGSIDGLPLPDYVLFDVSSLVNQDGFQHFIASQLLEGGEFGPILAEDGFLLLKRGAPLQPLPDVFFDFARADPSTLSEARLRTGSEVVTYPLVADFGDALRLHGFDLVFNRGEEVQAVLYLEATRRLDEEYFLALYLLDARGSPLGATIEDQPATVWYPTRRWQPGEAVKVTFNTLPWYTRDLSNYRLALGVMHGRDLWEPGARLAPTLPGEESLPYAVRLPDGGTLLELARFQQVYGMPAGGPVERQFSHPRPQNAIDVSLGGGMRLLGYDMAPVACEAGAEGKSGECWLELVLHWQAQQKMDVDYTVFVHVVGPDGQILAQRDAPPDRGAYPTSLWTVGEAVADPVRVPLPPDLPDGPLQMVVGMYSPDTGQRLPVLDDQGRPVDDQVILGQMR